MKILTVEAVPVRVPRVRSSRSAFGVRDFTEAGVVRVETDEGITGFGEISLIWGRQGSGLCDDVNALVASELVGWDPMRVLTVVRRLRQLLPARDQAPARAAVEMALLDITGKALGVPVHQLLGGAVRDTIELSFSLHMAAPEEMAAEAAELAHRGFTTLKVKMGREWPQDVRALTAVRQAVGEKVALRIDLNEAWESVSTASRRLAELAPLGVQLAEQPLPRDDIAGLARLRTRSVIPIAADESVWTAQDALGVIRSRAADSLNIYVSESGGLLEARHIAELADTAGLSYWIGSMPELGLGTAAIAHLAATLPGLTLASDACGFLYHSHDILTEPLEVMGGRLVAPTAPGLGVSVDEDAIDHFRMKGSGA